MSEALKKELVFYGSYHSDAINKLIHAVCVPVLLWTGMAMLATLELGSLRLSSDWQIDVTAGHVGTVVYILYYFYLFPALGAITFPILAGMDYAAHQYWNMDLDNKFLILLAIHVVSWIAQFIGHGMFEGRRPALMDSLLQALLTAPFFVFMEYCFFFGLFHDLHMEVSREIYKEIERKKAQ